MGAQDHVDVVMEQWRREAPSLDRSPMGIVGRISRLAQIIQPELEDVFAAHGLNGGEFDVLATLRRHGEPFRLTPTALSTALMVSSGGMTKRLAALEARGLVRREPDPDDGRSTAVALTAAGKRLVEDALPDHVANGARIVGGLSADERAELARLLGALALSLGDEAGARRLRRRR